MRVELSVDLRPARPVAAEKPAVDPEVRAAAHRRDREERWLRRIALARVIEAGVARGEFAVLADVSRRCGVSRARVSALTSSSTVSHLC